MPALGLRVFCIANINTDQFEETMQQCGQVFVPPQDNTVGRFALELCGNFNRLDDTAVILGLRGVLDF